MTQRTDPWENWHLERGFELLRIFGLEKTQNASTKTPIPPYPTHDDQAIDSLNPCPDKEPVLPRPDVNEIAANSRFLILSLTNTDMSKKSPFAIHKALIGIGGEPKSVKRLRSGDLLIETSSALQTKSFLLAKSFLDSPITISSHKTLNSCRGVISESDLLNTPDAEILDGFSDQGVIQVRRITIKKDNSVIPTKHLILTFNRPKLPTTIKAGYLYCKIRPYIPNPLRCFRCQSPIHRILNYAQNGNSKKIQEIRTNNNISYIEAKKLLPPQLPQTYAQTTKPSPISVTTQTEENITKIKCPPLKLLAPISSKQRTNIPTAVTPSSAQTQLLPSVSSKTSTTSDPPPPTPMSKTKGKIKEQPPQLHHPRKDSKTIDLLSIKPKTNLKKNPVKSTTLKTAREQDSSNETSPVSKKSRRRKTFKTSDAMDTDANPSDSDCVIGLASEEDESLLEADFKKMADNPLKGPLLPICVALQETFLKSCHKTKIRRYGCVRKDTEGPSVSGGVCIFTSLDVPSSALPLHTSLQAVAVRIHSTSLITVCCLYLPTNTAIHQHDLNNLINQLPAPFVILGDFNGHSTLWGSAKTNPRGRQIEQVLYDHCLCLLNHEEPTYFHEPTRSFHTLDLASCSPSLFPNFSLSIEKDLYNSDHFPVILSHDSDTDGKTFPPTYSYRRADWALFTQLAVITEAMVKTESVNTAVQEVTNVLIAAADLSIPKVSSHSFQHYKPWWNADCQTAYKNQRRLWGYFRRYPLRRISWRSKGKGKCSQSKASESEAILDPICVLTHFVNVQ
ncbi:RNA-directed DNA polymerase from mobile element jockey [Trichonephila clavipes]|nr:RNA-directed DNA polymerase from mobile element jockey [Trichonephila clavipes]